MKATIFLGIDTGCYHFEAALIRGLNPEVKPIDLGSFTNDLDGFEELVKDLTTHKVEPSQTLVCVEHIGPYNESLAHFLHGEGWKVWLAQPLKISKGSGEITRVKTDKIDAREICRYAVRFRDKARIFKPDSAFTRELKDLAKLRRQFVKDRAAWQTRLHANNCKAFPDQTTIKMIEATICDFNEKIKQLEKQIEQLIKSHQGAQQEVKIMRSIPGIGPVASTQLLLATGGIFNLASHRQLSALACSAPYPYKSGTSINRRPRTSKKGNRKLKGILFMGAMRVTQKGQIFHEYYHHRRAEGKSHQSVINDIINKMLKLVFDLCKKCELFDSTTYIRNKKCLQIA